MRRIILSLLVTSLINGCDTNIKQGKTQMKQVQGLQITGQVKINIENNKITSKKGFLLKKYPNYIKLYSPSSNNSNSITINGNQIHCGSGDNINGNKIVNSSININGDVYGVLCSGNGNIVQNININDDGIIITNDNNENKKEELLYELDLEVSKLEKIDMSGQTSLNIEDNTNIEDIDLSGQSIISFSTQSDILNIDVSGQSNVNLFDSRNIFKLYIDLSGQSQVNLRHNTINKLRADLSGMTQLNGSMNEIKNKKINKSRMSVSNI